MRFNFPWIKYQSNYITWRQELLKYKPDTQMNSFCLGKDRLNLNRKGPMLNIISSLLPGDGNYLVGNESNWGRSKLV